MPKTDEWVPCPKCGKYALKGTIRNGECSRHRKIQGRVFALPQRRVVKEAAKK